MNFIKAKVFINKKNGQPVISLPKKAFNKIPSEVKVAIPKEMMKKPIKKEGWW